MIQPALVESRRRNAALKEALLKQRGAHKAFEALQPFGGRVVEKQQSDKTVEDYFRSFLQKEILQKAVPSSGTTTLFHGADGLFGDCSINRDVIVSIVQPTGILAALPAYGTRGEVSKFATLTGYDPDGGDPEPAEPCDDAPSGVYKGCVIKTNLGRIARETQTIDIDDVIKRANAGDTDFQLRGTLLRQQGGLSMDLNLNNRQVLNVVVQSEMAGVGIAHFRKISQLVWRGDPVNSNVGGGYKEFSGLDMQIETGILDINGVACPSLDSKVVDWAYTPINGTTPDGSSIVDVLADMEFYLWNLAEDTGLNPVRWVIVMRPMAWRALTEIWPCIFNTNRCATAVADGTLFIDGQNMQAEIREMRRSMQLPLNGRTYDVITDTGILEQNSTTTPASLSAGEYASTIYFVPITISGGFPVTYIEYLNYRASSVEVNFGGLASKVRFWTDDGKFMWALQEKNFCFKLQAKIEPTVILRTPQLAGKIENVKYTARMPIRSAFPGEPTYVS